MTKRPLVFFVTAFILGCLFCSFLQTATISTLLVVFALLSAISIIISLVFKKRFLSFALVILVGFALSFSINLFIHIPHKENALKFDGFEGNVTGEIVSVSHRSAYDRVVLKTRTIGEDNVSFKVVFNCPENELPGGEGDILSLRASLHLIESDSLFFDTIRQNESEKIFLNLTPYKIELLDTGTNIFKKQIFTLRESCALKLEALDNNEFIKELLLGMKGSLDSDTRNDFKKLGLSHTLSVSGMHLSILVMSVYLLLKKNSLEKKSVSVLCSLITLFYMAITGFSHSIARAGIMLIVYFSSALFRRKPDTLTSLFVAAFFICAENPSAIFDIGFQLSFFATLGILVLGRKSIFYLTQMKFFTSRKVKTLKGYTVYFSKRALLKILCAFIINVSATLFTAPIILICFGTLTPFSFVANISVVFLISLLLIISAVYLVLSFLNVHFLLFIINLISNTTMLLISHLADFLPDPISYSPEISKALAVVLVLILVISLCVFQKKHTILFTVLSVSISLLVVQLAFYITSKNTAYITLSSSPRAYSVLIEEQGSKNLVCINTNDSPDSSVYQITSYRNVSKIDTATFFVKDDFNVDNVANLIEFCDVDTLVVISFENGIYASQKADLVEKIGEACEVQFVKKSKADISNSLCYKMLRGEYISLYLTKAKTKVALSYSLGDQVLFTNKNLEDCDGVALFGNVDYLPTLSPKDFYCYSTTLQPLTNKNTQNISDSRYSFIKINKNAAEFITLK